MKKNITLSFISVLVFSLLALPALAITEKPTLPTKTKPDQSIMIACVGKAVEARETAVSTAFDTYSSTIKTALQTRAQALKQAWSLTTTKEIQTAVKAAWKTAFEARLKAKSEHKKAVNSAWAQFNTARKTCKATSIPNIEAANQVLDNI